MDDFCPLFTVLIAMHKELDPANGITLTKTNLQKGSAKFAWESVCINYLILNCLDQQSYK